MIQVKKSIILICVLIILVSVLSACDKKSEGDKDGSTAPFVPNTTFGEKYETTASQYTVGDVQTSERFDVADNEYHIAYYDGNGAGAKMEIYRNGKLAYYYTSSSVDETGNCLQQKYYTAGGKYIGAFDNGYFFDENGVQISEDEMEAKLNK